MSYSFYSYPKFNQQEAVTYILYMILSSYFREAKCLNRQTEKKLFLHYREMPMKQQFKKEEIVIKQFEKLLRDLHSDLSELKAEVRIFQKESLYFILFEAYFETVLVSVNKAGKYRIRFFEEGKERTKK